MSSQRDPGKPKTMTARRSSREASQIEPSTPRLANTESTPREYTPPHLSGRVMSSVS